jgi:putative membrane protein
MTGFVATLISTAVALWVAARLVPGIEIPSSALTEIPDHLVSFGIVAGTFGVANGLVGPIVRGLAIPFNLFTMGLAGFVVNIALFLATAYVANELGGAIVVGHFPPELLSRETLVAAGLGSLVVGVVGAVVRVALPD